MVRRDLAYYTNRVAEELFAADMADCPQAAATHRELARYYSEMVERERIRPRATTFSTQSNRTMSA